MDEILTSIPLLCSTILAVLSAGFAVYQWIKRTIGSVAHLYSIVQEGCIASEQKFNGYNLAFSKDPTLTKKQHSLNKLQYAIEYIKQECLDKKIDYIEEKVITKITVLIQRLNLFKPKGE